MTLAPTDHALTRSAAPAPVDPSPTRPTSAHAVSLRGYGRTFAGGHTVLEDVTLDVAPGELVAVLGPSGCGKSTLLRSVAGLDVATAGTLELDGTPVRSHDPRCAVAFQEPRLLPWRDLARNVSLGLPRGTPAASGRERVAELLGLVGLTAFAGHRPRSVSGGMAQRASLARALAREPGVLLLDEPFGALDALTRLSMQDLLLDVLAARPTTVLLVTHDIDEAVHLADRIVVLGVDGGAGTGSAAGTGSGSGSGSGSGHPAPARIASITTVTAPRPREHGDASLNDLRVDLLGRLGVHRARG